jgi:hypothetical protein
LKILKPLNLDENVVRSDDSIEEPLDSFDEQEALEINSEK